MREDNEEVIFKKLEKVGEPFCNETFGLVQKYQLNMYSYSSKDKRVCFADDYDVYIKIKQTKENMEQEIEYFRDENNNAKHSNSEKIGKNLKPFDLEAAKAGKPVCTRDGRKARIICFDYKSSDDYSMIALIDTNDNEIPYKYTKEGKFKPNCTDVYDLMILPEKKEGYAVIFKDDLLKSEQDAKDLAEKSISEVVRIEKIEYEE